MTTYHVRTASIYRGAGLFAGLFAGLLDVDIDGYQDKPSGVWVVDGDDKRVVQIFGSCLEFEENNDVAERGTLIIEPPPFPIDELVGCRLVPRPPKKS